MMAMCTFYLRNVRLGGEAISVSSERQPQREVEGAHSLDAGDAPEVRCVHDRPEAAIARRVENIIVSTRKSARTPFSCEMVTCRSSDILKSIVRGPGIVSRPALPNC